VNNLTVRKIEDIFDRVSKDCQT